MSRDSEKNDNAGSGRRRASLVVAGPYNTGSTHLDGLAAALPGSEISWIAFAGLATPVGLETLAGGDATVVVANGLGALSSEARRAILMAWGAGSAPLLAIEAPPDVTSDAAPPIAREFEAMLRGLDGARADWFVIPSGLDALAAAIRERLATVRLTAPLRLWIESASDEVAGTGVEGMLVSGTIAAGAQVVVMPKATTATSASVTEMEARNRGAARRVRVQLDRRVVVAAGSLLADAEARPELADQIAAHILWTGAAPLLPGRPYTVALGGQRATAQIGALKHRINPVDLDPIAARSLQAGEVGLCNLSFSAPLLFDAVSRGRAMGTFMLADPTSGTVTGHGRIAFALRRATNIHWQALSVDKAARSGLKGQRPCCLWLTGLSGSGKSTVASLLEKRLNAEGRHTYTLDGDNVRHGLNRDLGFTDADRVENIRRVAEVAKLFVDSGLIVLVSFISPFRAERRMARDLLDAPEFLEIFVDTPIEVCEQRDPKGLYKKARAGNLKNFTGIDSPYEPPEGPEVHLRAGEASPEALVETIYREMQRRGIV